MDKELTAVKKFVSITCALILFAALIVFPDTAAASALDGLKLCASLIIPSLFPFFVATKLISELGLAQWLGKAFAPLSRRLFNVSGSGGTAFIIGVTAGYPMGAAYIASLCKNGDISKSEAERLLIFCNNSGPSFIIGAAGVGVFKSSVIGLFLYAVHILAAFLGGIMFAPNSVEKYAEPQTVRSSASFAAAFTDAVKASVTACLSICGFIVAFSVLAGILEKAGAFAAAAKMLSAVFGMELLWSNALFCGILELGNGIGAMSGLSASPINLALAAFILGWGGISVHMQTAAVLEGSKLKGALHFAGRLISASIASVLAYFAGILI